jgi:hypothetical protein
MGIDWKDQVHKAAGRTDNVLWAGSPMNVSDGGATGSIQVLAAQNSRVGIQVQNVGADTVYLGFDDTLVFSHLTRPPKYAVRLLTGEAWWVYLGEGVLTNPIRATCSSGVTSKLAFYELF